MITLGVENDNQQFVSVQCDCEAKRIKEHLVSKYPELQRGIYGVDKDEILIELYNASKSFYTFGLEEFKEAVKETNIPASVTVIIGNVDCCDCREYLR